MHVILAKSLMIWHLIHIISYNSQRILQCSISCKHIQYIDTKSLKWNEKKASERAPPNEQKSVCACFVSSYKSWYHVRTSIHSRQLSCSHAPSKRKHTLQVCIRSFFSFAFVHSHCMNLGKTRSCHQSSINVYQVRDVSAFSIDIIIHSHRKSKLSFVHGLLIESKTIFTKKNQTEDDHMPFFNIGNSNE